MTTVTLPRLLPMLATSTEPFDDEDFLFERKEDGVRAMAAVEQGSWRLWGREGQDLTGIYPELAVLGKLPSGTILDGELALLRDGRADFHALMARHRQRPKPLRAPLESVRYAVFLHLERTLSGGFYRDLQTHIADRFFSNRRTCNGRRRHVARQPAATRAPQQ